MKKKYYIFPLLLFPILINFLCMIPSSCSVGNSDTWIGFWGGYLGALVAFYAIYANIESNQEENRKTRTFEFNDKLRANIAGCMATLDITRIARAITKTSNGDLEKIDVGQLEAYENEVIIKYNTFLIMYDGICDSFTDHYYQVQKNIATTIRDIVNMYNLSVEHYNGHTREEAKVQTMALLCDIDSIQPSIDKLWESAKALVKEFKTKD